VASGKQVAREVLDALPEDCTLEEIQYHLHVRKLIEEGREDVRQGRVITQEELERDLASWLGR